MHGKQFHSLAKLARIAATAWAEIVASAPNTDTHFLKGFVLETLIVTSIMEKLGWESTAMRWAPTSYLMAEKIQTSPTKITHNMPRA